MDDFQRKALEIIAYYFNREILEYEPIAVTENDARNKVQFIIPTKVYPQRLADHLYQFFTVVTILDYEDFERIKESEFEILHTVIYINSSEEDSEDLISILMSDKALYSLSEKLSINL
jgi:hypothetical protein